MTAIQHMEASLKKLLKLCSNFKQTSLSLISIIEASIQRKVKELQVKNFIESLNVHLKVNWYEHIIHGS